MRASREWASAGSDQARRRDHGQFRWIYGVKWRGELREPAHRTFAQRRRAPPRIKNWREMQRETSPFYAAPPSMLSQIVLLFVIVLVIKKLRTKHVGDRKL